MEASEDTDQTVGQIWTLHQVIVEWCPKEFSTAVEDNSYLSFLWVIYAEVGNIPCSNIIWSHLTISFVNSCSIAFSLARSSFLILDDDWQNTILHRYFRLWIRRYKVLATLFWVNYLWHHFQQQNDVTKQSCYWHPWLQWGYILKMLQDYSSESVTHHPKFLRKVYGPPCLPGMTSTGSNGDRQFPPIRILILIFSSSCGLKECILFK